MSEGMKSLLCPQYRVCVRERGRGDKAGGEGSDQNVRGFACCTEVVNSFL